MFVKKGDKVKVLSGKDKGKISDVIKVLPKDGKVVVEGVNVLKRHSRKTQKNPQGGIVSIIKPIDASNVQLIHSKSGKPSRISKKIDGDKKIRFSNKMKSEF
ncbi:MAG: 50S ribosomal protein L24 [Patescibacteria group bacterium]